MIAPAPAALAELAATMAPITLNQSHNGTFCLSANVTRDRHRSRDDQVFSARSTAR